MIFIDSSVFVIDLRYPRDKEFSTNRRFLEQGPEEGMAVTSVANLLEICGILSFSLSPRQLLELYHHFPARYGVRVLPAHGADRPFPEVRPGDLLDLISKKVAFGDALILYLAERFAGDSECFVSWDARHLRGKTRLEVLTPREFLARGGG